MSLPHINVNIDNTIYIFPEDGNLIYKYSPFQNLKVIRNDGIIDLDRLTLNAADANIDINNPISLKTELSYDDSVNLLINDHKNPLKVVNSRFYLTSANSYKIADRRGNLDTNIYTSDNFPIEAGLIKTVRSIVGLDFLGIFDGGIMPVGNYHFYFKLADVDGNESDFISESGKVVCYIGAINNPSSIRGGLLDESSDKLIKFKLKNLDLAYNYINIYYTRTSGDDKMETLKTYKINDKFRINGTTTEISITGYEDHEEIDISEINVQYSSFKSVESTTNCQNMTFAGNVTRDFELYKTLEKYSLLVTPKLVQDADIGYLNDKYEESYSDQEGYEYYNPKNIYYKLGYWDEEIYRTGIVYILNDYTLSPVFNTRGITELYEDVPFKSYNISDTFEYGEDFIMNDHENIENLENAKGIFRIKARNMTIFDGKEKIKPFGIKFEFQSDVIEGKYVTIDGTSIKALPGLKDLTKGFFIVRQKRIPTLLTQGVGIATSNKSFIPVINGTFTDQTTTSAYFTESFLKSNSSKPMLGRGLFKLNSTTDVSHNALLCPEAALRPYIFNNFFNSSEFIIKKSKYNTSGGFVDESLPAQRILFSLGSLSPQTATDEYIKTNLLLIEPGIDLIFNNETKFSSKAGDPVIAWSHLDPVLGDLENLREETGEGETTETEWSNGVTKVRGEFNSYVGSTYNNIQFGQYYNIFQKNYNFEERWRDYFKIRANDSSPFVPISDRISWDTITPQNKITPAIYRGDCYINTYTHRMMWNFIDPEFPTNNAIVDPWTWYKNFRIKKTEMVIKDNVNGAYTDSIVADNTDGTLTGGSSVFSYKKILDVFTYRSVTFNTNIDTSDVADISTYRITLPDSKKFDKYAEANGIFGASKLNRADINSVGLGHWVTFKICSNVNLAMRDIDFSRPQEEAIHKMKRGFYPLQSAKPSNKLPESNVINTGISYSLGNKYYFEVPDVPFIKTSFSTRIHYSDILQESSFKNGNRVFREQNYQDYSNEYGALVKLIEWYGTLVAIMEHGVMMIPVNERAMMANASGENVYINTENVLPKNPKVLSNMFGSKWADSVVTTQRYIYGLDTIGKKVWRTNGETFEIISDLKIQKFLNDNIQLSIMDKDKTPGISAIKTHYNAFKHDIMFTYIYKNISWHLCWNELQNKWVTQYTWFPEFSENINNIFYTFANEKNHPLKGSILYKHGFAGADEELGNIQPTHWYDEQHPFEYEFVVIGVQGVQKIFNNLQIISNWAEPESFEFEIVGEGFDWGKQKSLILSLSPSESLGLPQVKNELINNYFSYLSSNPNVAKLPFIWCRNTNIFNENWPDPEAGSKDINLKNYKSQIKPLMSYQAAIDYNHFKEQVITVYQQAKDIKDFGRLSGNMQYLEDLWDVQIQPINFKYAYASGGNLLYSDPTEMLIRDKYMKVRVRYSGEKYAIINAIRTLFIISYA